ncbi:MAG: lactate utilization protein C [Puniceicoccaceae bacterium]
MSNDRETIFSSIQKALEPLPERTAYPDWDDDMVISKSLPEVNTAKELFAEKLVAASGKYFDAVNQLVEFMLSEGYTFGYCDPSLAYHLEDKEGIRFDTEYDMAKVDEYQFGITRASAAIAETGTLMLNDNDTSARLGALAPWLHIAVVNEEDIAPTVLDAIHRFGDDPNIIFATGPSKTADVEGILIQGVHGPGIQVALVV